MSSDRSDGGLDWPAGWDRTPPGEREATRKFEATVARTFDDIEAELDRIGADDHRYGFAARRRERDDRPYTDADPDDPGFVLRWSMDGEQYAVACDRYTAFRDNARAVYLYLREKRKMEARPVVTGRSEFATARLPAGDAEAVATGGTGGDDGRLEVRTGDRRTMTDEVAADLLGLASPDVDSEVVRVSYQEAVKVEHPDRGGDGDIDRLRAARDHLLDDA